MYRYIHIFRPLVLYCRFFLNLALVKSKMDYTVLVPMYISFSVGLPLRLTSAVYLFFHQLCWNDQRPRERFKNFCCAVFCRQPEQTKQQKKQEQWQDDAQSSSSHVQRYFSLQRSSHRVPWWLRSMPRPRVSLFVIFIWQLLTSSGVCSRDR